METPYLRGKANGDRVIRYADGTVSEGSFVDGIKQGRWVVRNAGGLVEVIHSVDGIRDGTSARSFQLPR